MDFSSKQKRKKEQQFGNAVLASTRPAGAQRLSLTLRSSAYIKERNKR